jgi:hypothetical protein
VLVQLITNITGLVRWTDYTPVKFIGTAKDTYDQDGGHQAINLTNMTDKVAGIDYINIYEDLSATTAWTDYIPIYKVSGFAVNTNGAILIETGFVLLAENGDRLILE